MNRLHAADQKETSVGTAFFVTKHGHLVTNYHVIKGSNDIAVLIEGKGVQAVLLRKGSQQ